MTLVEYRKITNVNNKMATESRHQNRENDEDEAERKKGEKKKNNNNSNTHTQKEERMRASAPVILFTCFSKSIIYGYLHARTHAHAH